MAVYVARGLHQCQYAIGPLACHWLMLILVVQLSFLVSPAEVEVDVLCMA